VFNDASLWQHIRSLWLYIDESSLGLFWIMQSGSIDLPKHTTSIGHTDLNIDGQVWYGQMLFIFKLFVLHKTKGGHSLGILGMRGFNN